MTARTFRYSSVVNTSLLRANPQHNFAQGSAMSIYPSRAVYTMIPKNACSTLRLSIAIANGAIEDESQWHWIHHNNDSFRPSLAELATASYTFVVLRCPYARLASCFLDKFVGRTPEAWNFHQLAKEAVDPAQLTFRQFCKAVCQPPLLTGNIHWRPQTDFLVYKSYDDYFCVELFDAAKAKIESRIGLKIADARPLTRHGSGLHEELPVSEPHCDTEVWKIEARMHAGSRPHPASLYDAELRALVARAYDKDLALFRGHFPGLGLFDEGESA